MIPDVTAIAAVTAMLQVLSGWKAWGVLVAITMGPWVCLVTVVAILIDRIYSKLADQISLLTTRVAETDANIKERFDRTVRNYEDNVVLVQGYEQLSETLAQTIKRNTEAITRLNDRIDNNHFCPASRIKERSNE